MKSLSELFNRMHAVDFPYVVMRNWENLPDSVTCSGHGDLDLLVYDIHHWKELFPEAILVHPQPRVRHKITVDGVNTYLDVRFVGDGYYPTDFELNMINTRECNERGFFTPNPVHFRIGLAYHVVHHKGSNTYINQLGDATIYTKYGVDKHTFNTQDAAERFIKENPEYSQYNIDKREGLLDVLKRSNVGYSIPSDPTVGRYNQYWRGATSVVSKKDGKVFKAQESWQEFNLIDNEYRILENLQSRHFPKATKCDDGIELEDCGDRMTVYNLPDDWRQQMAEILRELKQNKVQHRDIKPDNLMVKGGVIKLIDFGWARFESDPPDSPPACLGYPYRPTWGWDDNFSIKKIIKEFEFKQEELLCAS